MRKLSDKKQEVLLRRGQVAELHSQGLTEQQMAKRLDCSQATISSDIRVMVNQALTNIQRYERRVPYEYESMLTGIKLILRREWTVYINEQSAFTDKQVQSAKDTILKCYAQIRDLIIDKSNISEVMPALLRESPLISQRQEKDDRLAREAYESQRRRDQAVF